MYWIKTVYLENYNPEWGPLEHKPGNLCADMRAAIPEAIQAAPGKLALVPLGVKFDMEMGYGFMLLPRSSMAMRGLLVITGLIDPDYRGEIHAQIFNPSPYYITIQPGERICQLYAVPRERMVFMTHSAEKLSSTARGEQGFGSTGRI